MAEIISKNFPLGKKSHKNLRVDLTPMVDLGFILITFFVFTTSLQEKMVMKLIMPKDSGDSTLVSGEAVIRIAIDSNNIIHWSETGLPGSNDGYIRDVRTLIADKRKKMHLRNLSPGNLSVIIQPLNNSTYGDLVDVIDELTIADCKRYFILEK